jgi:hypothetical protein
VSITDILNRAERTRRSTDGIMWEGICTRCGLSRKAFADEILEETGDVRSDIRDMDFKCHSPRCLGRIRWSGKASTKRALHLNDIRRRR